MTVVGLLACVACSWFCVAHASQASAATTISGATTAAVSYRVRRREGVAAAAAAAAGGNDMQHNHHRYLTKFVPSFSADDSALPRAKMPELTLLLRGLDGKTLGDKAYDALQTAMNDYLRKRFEDYFEPRYKFTEVETKVVGDVPFESYSLPGGNAVTMETYLTFRDLSFSPREEETSETEIGPRQRQQINRESTFRQSDLFLDDEEPEEDSESGSRSSTALPSELELELAAGYAWRDLTSFNNHLLVAATIESLESFNDLKSIDSLERFPSGEEVGDEIALSEDDYVGNEQETIEEPQPEKPSRGDVVAAPKPGSTLNVAAASSSLKQSGTNRLNPLWPALIVGIAVFLCTIIVLGYRKQKARGKDPFGGFGKSNRRDAKPDNVVVHISNDRLSLQGDEEIEVEDQLYNHPDPYEFPVPREDRKKQQRDLDKEYAASCFKPLTSPQPPSTSAVSDIEDDYEDENDEAVSRKKKKKTCLRSMGSRRKARRVSLQEQDSMALDSNSRRGVHLPRKIDLTETRNQSSWSYPSRTGQDGYNSGDLNTAERKRLVKYMEAGLSVEEASEQILIERNANEQQLVPPSFLSRTRSGDFAGYSNTRSNGQRQQREKEQSSLMDCCPSGEGEATAVSDEEQKQAYMSLGAACSTTDPDALQEILNNGHGADNRVSRSNSSGKSNARAMVITAASSYASSYDDDEFDAAMEEVGAETAMA